MQQHDRSPKKQKMILYFTYGVMTMAVAIISAVCIFLVLGYRLDLKSGDVEQGSLLQFRSFPSGATITLDREVLSFVTPGKRNVDAGNHTVMMQLDGYLDWQKTFAVKASELRWLNYARLVPETIKTTTLKEFPTLAGELPSPDKKWIIAQPTAEKPEFTLIDIRDEKKPVFSQLTVPADRYLRKEGVPSVFSLVEWDFGARYVLVKHTAGDVTEFIRLDRTDPDQTVNLSTKLGINIEDIHFSGTSGNVYYALENGSLRRLDSGAGTISQPIVKDVASFKIFKTTTLAYVKKPVEEKIGVGVVIDSKPRRVATYDATQPVYIDVNQYFSDYYMAVARGTSVTIYKDPQLDTMSKFARFSTVSSPAWLKFGNSGRFVITGVGTQFTTYDLETKEQFAVNLPGTAPDLSKAPQWLDDYYLVSAADNDLRITEFDGANQHVITSSLPGFPVTLSDNGQFLFSFNKTQTGTVALQSSAMTTKR